MLTKTMALSLACILTTAFVLLQSCSVADHRGGSHLPPPRATGSAPAVYELSGPGVTSDDFVQALRPRDQPRNLTRHPTEEPEFVQGIEPSNTRPNTRPSTNPNTKPKCGTYQQQATQGFVQGISAVARIPNLNFETNSAELRPGGNPVLDKLGDALATKGEGGLDGYCIKIDAYTDNRGNNAYNLRLSQRRAESVARYLEQRHGIAPDRLIAEGHGASDPVCFEQTETCWARNRRADIVSLGTGR
jgi:outer membrane protein OmpA-like peptidoglycan-associated protein